MPITEAERNFKREHGLDALENRFETQGISLISGAVQPSEAGLFADLGESPDRCPFHAAGCVPDRPIRASDRARDARPWRRIGRCPWRVAGACADKAGVKRQQRCR